MMEYYQKVCDKVSRLLTRNYTTSFYYGIQMLNKRIQQPIYSIYGFVRLADEIVDTLHHEKVDYLFRQFKQQTDDAIEMKISTNPILQSFQHTFHQYNIDKRHVDRFLKSMEMDLHKTEYTDEEYQDYIVGSAEVVGLMCLHVFCEADRKLYEELIPTARLLGSAMQKINFLRDIKADGFDLGRTYFPDVDLTNFTEKEKKQIEADIEGEFWASLEGIKKLPDAAKKGVYLGWMYYYHLLEKIKNYSPEHILNNRVRISNMRKLALMAKAQMDIKLGKV